MQARSIPPRTVATPAIAVLVLVLAWGRSLPPAVMALVGAVLIGAVLVAVHHAEVVAHRVGEPFGSLVLAVAVTVIEVGLILSVMLTGHEGGPALARDTVFAALMITSNGVVGLCTELVLLALNALIAAITVAVGTAIVLQGVIQLVVFATFLFLAVSP